jgi:P pilus assembly chaperone PapD
MVRPFYIGAVVLVFQFVSLCAHAYDVKPVILNWGPQEDSHRYIHVRNTSDRPLAIDTAVYRRATAQAVNDPSALSASADISVMPPQAYLEAGEEATLNLVWNPDTFPQSTQSYYVTLYQLPIIAPEYDEAQGLELLVNFSVAVHVGPPKEEAE